MSETVLTVDRLGKCYVSYRNNIARFASWFGFPARHTHEYWAIKDVSFSLRRGEAIGLIGKNGAGKSSLLKLITGTVRQTTGTVELKGRVSAILELGLGFNPDFTGVQNIYLAGGMMGFSTEEISDFIPEIQEFAELGEFFEQPLRVYSSGMQARLAFALATCRQPDLLIVDEALSVGDMAFQRKCYRRIESYLSSGTSILFVSHDLESVRRLCNSAMFLKGGVVAALGASKDVCDYYERDLFGVVNESQVIDCEINKQVSFPEVLDKELVVPSEDSYGDGRAEIFDRWIEDEFNRRINVINRGQHISWCYKIRFLDNFHNFTVAMRIKTIDGVGVFGSHKKFEGPIQSGDEIEVNISLKNHLAPGIYYLNCAVLDDSDICKFLHRRVDTYAIRVVSSDLQNSEGLVDMEPEFLWSFSESGR